MKYTEINQTDKSICSQPLPMIHPEEWGFKGATAPGGGWEDEVLASCTAAERKVVLKHTAGSCVNVQVHSQLIYIFSAK